MVSGFARKLVLTLSLGAVLVASSALAQGKRKTLSMKCDIQATDSETLKFFTDYYNSETNGEMCKQYQEIKPCRKSKIECLVLEDACVGDRELMELSANNQHYFAQLFKFKVTSNSEEATTPERILRALENFFRCYEGKFKPLNRALMPIVIQAVSYIKNLVNEVNLELQDTIDAEIRNQQTSLTFMFASKKKQIAKEYHLTTEVASIATSLNSRGVDVGISSLLTKKREPVSMSSIIIAGKNRQLTHSGNKVSLAFNDLLQMSKEDDRDGELDIMYKRALKNKCKLFDDLRLHSTDQPVNILRFYSLIFQILQLKDDIMNPVAVAISKWWHTRMIVYNVMFVCRLMTESRYDRRTQAPSLNPQYQVYVRGWPSVIEYNGDEDDESDDPDALRTNTKKDSDYDDVEEEEVDPDDLMDD